MSARIVQSKSGFVSSGQLTVTLDAPVAVGSLIAVMGAMSLSPPSGFGVATWDETSNQSFAIRWGVATTAGQTLTIASGGRSFAQGVTVMEIAGVEYVAGAAAPKASSSGTSTTPNTGTVTPAASSIVLATWYALAAYSAGPTNGLTRLTPTGGGGVAIVEYGYQIGVSAPIDSGITLASSASWQAVAVAFAETASGGRGKTLAGSYGLGLRHGIGL